MNSIDVICMAREAGFEFNSLGGTFTSGMLNEHLVNFAALVAAAEREECAKVCEAIEDYYGSDASFAIRCADAIRARK